MSSVLELPPGIQPHVQYREVNLAIYGTRPLMQTGRDRELSMDAKTDEATAVAPNLGKPRSPEQYRKEAWAKRHVTEEGLFYHPLAAFWGALMDAAAMDRKVRLERERITAKGEKKIAYQQVDAVDAMAQFITWPPEDRCVFYDPDALAQGKHKPIKDQDWRVDRRTIQGTKGQLIIARPKLIRWATVVTWLVTVEAPDDEVFLAFMNYAGQLGVGSGRLHRVRLDNRSYKMVWKGLGYGKFVAVLIT